jgi:hypothetical protein
MRDQSGIICFGYEFNCSHCKKTTTILDTTRRFSRPDWWNELAAWHNAAPTVKDVVMLAATARRSLPKIGPAIVGPYPLERLWIRGGYKGEVGPVMLVYEGVEENVMFGVLRLEKNNHVSLFDHGDPDCLPRHECQRFAATPDGGVFQLDNKPWVRMSSSEIEEIIRDRVFTMTELDQVEPAKRRKAQSKSTRQSRGSYESAHAPKGGKGSRRASRNAGEVDSRRRRP